MTALLRLDESSNGAIGIRASVIRLEFAGEHHGWNGKTIVAVIVVVVLIAAAVGVYALQQPATGTISIYVKDDVIAWKHVNITFSEVKVHQASDNNNSGWQSILIKNGGSIDLASLTNVSELLASSAIRAGKYIQI